MSLPPGKARACHAAGIVIDGVHGEGGGQIVRTACALSALTGIPCRLENIRAGRERPGLRPQHCTAVRGVARMCGATTSDIRPGEQRLSFSPGPLRPCDLELDVGTAGCVGLVLQCLQLAAVGMPGPMEVLVRGGTDVQGGPPPDFIRNVKLPTLARMGFASEFVVLRRGYFPKGGGAVRARWVPPRNGCLAPLCVPVGTEVSAAFGISHASRLLAEKKVVERNLRAVRRMLTDTLHVPVRMESEYGASRSAGAGIVVWAHAGETVFGASALASRTVQPGRLADVAAEGLLKTYHARAALDLWLGDQILPYLGLADGPSVISVPRLTRHMKTNMWVVQQFLNVRFFCEYADDRVLIHCTPAAAADGA